MPNLDDGTVSQYKVNADGTLSANLPATLMLPSGAAPDQVVVNAAGTFAYMPDENLNVV